MHIKLRQKPPAAVRNGSATTQFPCCHATKTAKRIGTQKDGTAVNDFHLGQGMTLIIRDMVYYKKQGETIRKITNTRWQLGLRPAVDLELVDAVLGMAVRANWQTAQELRGDGNMCEA